MVLSQWSKSVALSVPVHTAPVQVRRRSDRYSVQAAEHERTYGWSRLHSPLFSRSSCAPTRTRHGDVTSLMARRRHVPHGTATSRPSWHGDVTSLMARRPRGRPSWRCGYTRRSRDPAGRGDACLREHQLGDSDGLPASVRPAEMQLVMLGGDRVPRAAGCRPGIVTRFTAPPDARPLLYDR